MSKKILIIDDSALMRRAMSDIIKTKDEFEVVAVAKDGLEGLNKITANPALYDAIILDVNMPHMGGIELLEELYKAKIKHRTIIVSSTATEGTVETIRALELGAFDFVRKPDVTSNIFSQEFSDTLLRTLGMLFESDELKKSELHDNASQEGNARVRVTKNTGKTGMVVALACSTGGPKALQSLLPLLPANLNAPVVIVQHMPKGFTASLSQRLNELSSIKVSEAKEGDVLENGHVYIAPGGRHLEIVDTVGEHRIHLNDEPPIDALRPCANVMYSSLESCSFTKIVCVVLTGMGMDGTKGIKGLDNKKDIYVIAQDKESSVVYGMPRAVKEAGLVDEVVPLEKIADTIIKNVGVS